MGQFLSWLWNVFFGKRELRILMIGLDASGKTTILYKLKLGEVVATIPTAGFNVETVEYKNLRLTVWDIGGQEKIRTLWHHYFHNTNGLIYAIDSNDAQRLPEARDILHDLLKNTNISKVPLIVFANKQDLPGARSVASISEDLQLRDIHNRPWYIQGSCGTTGDGLYEGLDWLAAQSASH